jgi:hypothetical protein
MISFFLFRLFCFVLRPFNNTPIAGKYTLLYIYIYETGRTTALRSRSIEIFIRQLTH